MAGRTKLTSYIQNGLIAMFDGVENAGYGVHTEDPAKLREVVSGALIRQDENYPLEITCENNAILVHKNDIAAPRYAYFDSLAVGDANRNGTITVEICCLPSTETITSYNAQEWGIRINVGNVQRWQQSSSALCVRCNGRLLYVPAKNIGNASAFNANVPIIRTETQVMPSVGASFAHCKVYHNSDRVTSSKDFYASTKDIFDGIKLEMRLHSSTERTHPYKVYNVRVYNRELTAEEVARNYKVDRMRFDF